MPSSNPNPTYYEILNLSPSTLTTQEEAGGEPAAAALIKRAYRRALLNHHPDKKPSSPHHHYPPSTTQTHTQHTQTYTVDQISTAYATLSRPAQRQAYDTSLLLSQRQSLSQSTTGGGSGEAAFQTGIETIDLDDLECDEDETQWYRACRCGNPRGYCFTEADLEDAADLGELMVGCADCSLWLRVCFAVVEENGDGDDNGVGRQEASNGNGTEGGISGVGGGVR
jgi:curved DNA-binding protein CbpA